MGQPKEKPNGNGRHSTPKNIPAQLVPTLWKPGESGNPSGRPKGPGLVQYIRDQTMDGRELIDFLLNVVRGNGLKFNRIVDRIKATEILMDRAFGKVPSEAPGGDKIRPTLDLDKLTEQELEFLENVRLGLAAIHKRVTESAPEGEAPANGS